MRPKRPGVRGETLGAEGRIETGHQPKQAGTGDSGSRPQHPGTGEVPESVDAQGRGGQICHGLRRQLDSAELLGAERAQKAQRQMQIQGMGSTCTLRQAALSTSDQGRADLLVRPERKEPALGIGVQASRSSRTSRAMRTAWWRTSSRFPANCRHWV